MHPQYGYQAVLARNIITQDDLLLALPAHLLRVEDLQGLVRGQQLALQAALGTRFYDLFPGTPRVLPEDAGRLQVLARALRTLQQAIERCVLHDTPVPSEAGPTVEAGPDGVDR